MLQAEVLAALEKEAKNRWDRYPLALDDRPYKPTEQNTVWVRHSVVFGEAVRMSIGVGFYRYPGIQYLSIFYQPGSGNASLYEYSDLMVARYSDLLLRTAGGNTVTFEVASTNKLPKDATGYGQLQVICPFYFDTRS